MYRRLLEELKSMRRVMRITICVHTFLISPFGILMLILTWGDGIATFIGVITLFYGWYHLVDAIQLYRWILDEEGRVLRAYQISGKEEDE